MTIRQSPICPSFNVPYFVICSGRVYLSGYSYYRLRDPSPAEAKSLQPLSILCASREEANIIQELRWSIGKSNFERLKAILDQYPALPRLLNTARGRCEQDVHEALFGHLLSLGRTRDLERLYGVVTADGTLEDGTLPPEDSVHLPIMDSDEAPHYEMISQRETFGSRAALVHERICAKRSESTLLTSCWSPDAIACRRGVDYHLRWPVRGFTISRMVGKGSFGYVFETPVEERQQLTKYSTTTAEYLRELFSQCLLAMTSADREVETPTSVTSDMIQNHLLALFPLRPITRVSSREFAALGTRPRGIQLCFVDQLALLVRTLFEGVRSLRDRFIMHLDLSTTNVMWDETNGRLRVIDYAGTIGDDSFLDIGTIVSRVCTRSTRPPEYGSSETLWQRNESSETLAAYYSLMSHAFEPEVINDQPYAKENLCAQRILQDLDTWDFEWRAAGGLPPGEAIPQDIQCLRRVHEAARSLPRDRPSLDWLLSTGNDQSDRAALELGCIGSMSRYLHVRNCLTRFVSRWPRGSLNPQDDDWKARRVSFIALLLARIDTPGIEGVSCGGLLRRMVPPPYTTTRCIALYDALRDIMSSSSVETVLNRYLTDLSCYPVLVNAILYVSLSSAKTAMIEVEHYSGHPLHVILRALTQNLDLMSIFLSPITAYALLLLETPKATVNDEAALEVRRSIVTPIPQPATSHRIIRCLYNLRRDRRCRPMFGPSLIKMADFTRAYMSRILRAPLVIDDEADWWKLLRNPEGSAEIEPGLSREAAVHVDNVIRLWFT